MADVDIFIGNNTLIDPEVYHIWLNGHTAHEAAVILQKRGVLQQYGATFDMLFNDTLDHYRVFAMLEKYLQCPTRVSEQLTFQLKPDTQRKLIQKYYGFDSTVIREILGKKLSSRNRKDLDDVSEKTKVPLRSCRRQFDNVKRVFKIVEEMLGSLVDNIKSNFLVSEELAKQYAAIVFITNNRFETGKKKLQYLTFDDFVHCANQMIVNWSYSSKDCKDHEDMDQDLDRDFLHGLRELKPLSEKESLDEHKGLVSRSVSGKLSPAANVDMESNFKLLSKNVLHIATDLNHSKSLRDLFIDLVEKFIEPCRHSNWTFADVNVFLTAYTETSYQLQFFRINPQLLKPWQRFIVTVASCTQQMYHT